MLKFSFRCMLNDDYKVSDDNRDLFQNLFCQVCNKYLVEQNIFGDKINSASMQYNPYQCYNFTMCLNLDYKLWVGFESNPENTPIIHHVHTAITRIKQELLNTQTFKDIYRKTLEENSDSINEKKSLIARLFKKDKDIVRQISMNDFLECSVEIELDLDYDF